MYARPDETVHAKVLRYAYVINGVNARMLRVNGPTSRTRRVSTAVANPLAMTLLSAMSTTLNNFSFSSTSIGYLLHVHNRRSFEEKCCTASQIKAFAHTTTCLIGRNERTPTWRDQPQPLVEVSKL
uniref:uncharacterized protein LOC117606940 n=1 Tax=Osmia lignaria TaxID=473952 RepID=UPI001478C8A2|nr:uncharacterized protein LOC117606940 [Osmia lignaria]